jgi:Protein of unknown function (DUF1588)/Protein of unknown function (DUF1592)/Protein of unknown function (DUF1595)/Protein of unknown function (DUF1585)
MPRISALPAVGGLLLFGTACGESSDVPGGFQPPAVTAGSSAGGAPDPGNPSGGGLPVGGTAGAGAGGSSSGAATGGSEPVGACAAPGQPNAPVLHARLLTPSQYAHVVQDMVKVGGNPAKGFGGGVASKLDELAVEQRAHAAADVASKAAASLASWSPCVPSASDAAACAGQIIDKLGQIAFRHPLSADERAQLKKLFDAGSSEKDFATGVEWLLTGLLQAPDFLYQFAKPQASEVAGQVVPLGGHEIASRLALFIWDGAPDDVLFAEAQAGRLSGVEGVAAQAQRLLSDPRFERGTDSFYHGWLKLESFAEVARDDPGLTSEVVAALQESLLLSATSLYSAANPNIESLFNGDTYYLNGALRAFYRVGTGGAAFEPVALPNEQRRGVLTHPALMTMLARPAETNPISRGLFVQRTLLCNDIPLPPQGFVIPQLPPEMPGLSTRARLERHTEAAQCAVCHNQIDPPGFALENYDPVGRYRTRDADVDVDSSGTMPDTSDVAGPFATGAELVSRLAKSEDVKRCFAQNYLAHAVARNLAAEDSCTLSGLADKFAASGDLKQLIVEVATSDAFRLRTAEGLGAQK